MSFGFINPKCVMAYKAYWNPYCKYLPKPTGK